MTFKEKINDLIGDITNKFSSLSQAENNDVQVEKEISEGMPEKARQAAAEGAVLLKNDGVLPLKKGTVVSLFGRTYKDYFFVGYGSGGDVNRPYNIDLAQGIENCDDLVLNEELHNTYMVWREKNPVSHGYWAHWPLRYEEMPLTDEIVEKARAISETAVVTIGRSSGEDRDCNHANGSYYLHDEEIAMLDKITEKFKKIIVLLNVGNIIDMSWVKHYGDKIGAIIYVWQGGMESGNAIADILCGKVSPSGKLTDTIAKAFSDYPSSAQFGNKKVNEYTEDIYVGYRYFETFAKDKVLYPFGFGLSYTDFEIKTKRIEADDDGFVFEVEVKNIGETAGKEVVQLYLSKPCGRLGNPARELVAFAKTKTLEPNESEIVTLSTDMYSLTSYDDCGATNNANSYVIESGEYDFYIGNSVRDCEKAYSYFQEELLLWEQLKQVCAPKYDFRIFKAEEINGKITLATKSVAKEKYDMATRILNHIPQDIEQTGDKGIKLNDVKNKKATMDEFVAQLDNTELEAITRGGYKMDHPLGPKGNAGIYGGVLESLREKGVRPVVTTDGPSGIRLVSCCSLLPIGALLACSFNTELVTELYEIIAKEMKKKGTDVLLAPGMNIHRNPLCGRNFEYFSEDPYVSGKFGAACVKGIQSQGGSACPKHFACNNQELCRNTNDSRVSERALRQIYLKGFEICVKEAQPKNIMTSYNKINGVWCHYNYDTCVTVLRNEWGYEGNIMTDWWMKPSKSIEFPKLKDQAYRVRSGVNLLMPGGDRVTNEKPDGTLLATLGKPNGITLGEIQESAKWILKSIIDIEN